jgi:hypothetical protein
MTRSTGWVLGSAVLALLVLLLARDGRDGDPARTAAGDRAAHARLAERAPGGATGTGPGAADAAGAAAGAAGGAIDQQRAARALGALDPAQVWRAQVARAVQRVAQGRLGHPLPPETETQLLDALKSVGPAARDLDRERLDPDDPASIERVRTSTAALVEADRVCRAALGIGVSELIRSLDPSRIDDQARSAPDRE